MKAKYLLAVMFFMIAGCQKQITRLTSDAQGTWELVSSDGAWSGHREYEPGNGNTISFSGNTYSQKIKIRDSTYQYSGTFTIYTAKPCDVANEQTLIKFNDNEISSFSLSNGKLTIGKNECILFWGKFNFKKNK